MAVRILLRKDTSTNWNSANPVLLNGELGLETDTSKLKVGDGVTTWTSLGYLTNGTTELDELDATGITDGFVLTADGLGGAVWEALPAGGGGIGAFIDTSIAISSDDTALANDDGTANHNIGLGYFAGNALTTGGNNILLGQTAGQSLTTANYSIGIGFGAIGTANPSQTVAIGYLAGNEATGNGTFLGSSAGRHNTSGTANVFIGANAGQGDPTSKLTGSNNIAVGGQAYLNATTGVGNVALGQQTLRYTTTGSYNVALGVLSGDDIETGSQNVAIGRQALRGFNATGDDNIAIGYLTGWTVGNASGNVMIGREAGYDLISGNNNTFVGYRAGGSQATVGTTTASNNTCLGNLATPSSATAANEITLGDSNITTLRCAQTSITAISDARDKTNVTPLDAGLNLINELNPVRFDWAMRYDPETEEAPAKNGMEDVGFLAQELASAQAAAGVTIPKLVFDANPDRLEATYGHLLPVMVKAIKELSAKNDMLEARIAALENLNG